MAATPIIARGLPAGGPLCLDCFERYVERKIEDGRRVDPDLHAPLEAGEPAPGEVCAWCGELLESAEVRA